MAVAFGCSAPENITVTGRRRPATYGAQVAAAQNVNHLFTVTGKSCTWTKDRAPYPRAVDTRSLPQGSHRLLRLHLGYGCEHEFWLSLERQWSSTGRAQECGRGRTPCWLTAE